MDCRFLSVFGGLFLVVIGTNTGAGDYAERQKIGLFESGVIQSLGFPGCCESSHYMIELAVPEADHTVTGYIRLVFSDLDLPPGGTLKIHDGPMNNSPLYYKQPRLRGRTWTRPVVVSSGQHLLLNFSASSPGKQRYVGYKASFWTVNVPESHWSTDIPFTNCPRVKESMEGGEVRLDVHGTEEGAPSQYIHDCVWQFKPPVQLPDFQVFIRIVAYDLKDGHVEIRSDIHSEAEIVTTLQHSKASGDDIIQPYGGFSSTTGFYIRVKKPLERGFFQFIYGVFTPVNNATKTCSLDYWGVPHQGFRCASISWCIPTEYKCDHIAHCPDRSDEDPIECEPASVYVVHHAPAARQSIDCPVHHRRCSNGQCLVFFIPCDDELCAALEYECQDKECVYALGNARCSRYQCNKTFERTCLEGKCVGFSERCPEDECPSYMPYPCGDGSCIYRTEYCDEKEDCVGGQDEPSACQSQQGVLKLIARISITFVIFPMICLIVYAKYKCAQNCKRGKKEAPEPDDQESDDEESRQMMHPVHKLEDMVNRSSIPHPSLMHKARSMDTLEGIESADDAVDMDYEGSMDALSIDVLADEIKRDCKEECEILPRERQDSLERLMLSLQVIEEVIVVPPSNRNEPALVAVIPQDADIHHAAIHLPPDDLVEKPHTHRKHHDLSIDHSVDESELSESITCTL